MPASNERTPLLENNCCSGASSHVIVQVTYPKDLQDYEPLLSTEEITYALSMEELLLYKTDPWWQFVRRTIFLTFWLVLLLIFLTAILLAYTHGLVEACKALAVTKLSTTLTAATDRIATNLLNAPMLVPAMKIAP